MVRSNHLRLAGVLVLAVLLTGCGFFQKRADRRDHQYRSTVEHAPLQVPPGLESPGTASALAIPPITATGTAVAGIAPPQDIGPAGAEVALGDMEMAVADSVENVWRRVGEALESSATATIVSRDARQAIWRVEMAVEVASEASAMRRLLTLGMAGRSTQKMLPLVVKVLADEDGGSGSVVQILGAPGSAGEQAAVKLFAELRERLS